MSLVESLTGYCVSNSYEQSCSEEYCGCLGCCCLGGEVFGMFRLAITFVFAFLFSVTHMIGTAAAKNWNHKSNDQQPNGYSTFEKLPCSFNGATVGHSAYPPRDHDKTYKQKLNRCRKGSFTPVFYSKDGTSIKAPYGSPIVAIADMDFYYGLDYSSEYRCVGKWYKKGFTTKLAGPFDFAVSDPANPNLTRRCQKPYDGIELVFKVKGTEELVKYYHLSSTPIVPGFGLDDCKKPLMKDRATRHTRYPEECGGVAIRSVKKGEIIGYAGAVGGDGVIGLNIFRNGRWLIAPEDHTRWESSPKNSDYFLLPVIKKPVLPKKGLVSVSVILFDELAVGLKEQIAKAIWSDEGLRNCVFENSNIKEGSWRRFYQAETIKLVVYHTLTSSCFNVWKKRGAFTKSVVLDKQTHRIDRAVIRKEIRTSAKFRKCLSETHIGEDRVNTAFRRNMSDTAAWVVEAAAKTECVKQIQ
jgi:hypothetical protein